MPLACIRGEVSRPIERFGQRDKPFPGERHPVGDDTCLTRILPAKEDCPIRSAHRRRGVRPVIRQAFPGKSVDSWRCDVGAVTTETIGAELVGQDEEEVQG